MSESVVRIDKLENKDKDKKPEVVNRGLVKAAVGRWGQLTRLAKLITPLPSTRAAPAVQREKSEDDFDMGDLFATEAGQDKTDKTTKKSSRLCAHKLHLVQPLISSCKQWPMR